MASDTKAKPRRLSIAMPEKLLAQIEAMAEADCRTPSGQAVYLLTKQLSKEGKKS